MKRIIFILGIALLSLWATVPFGSIAPWNQALMALLLLGGSGMGLWLMYRESAWLNVPRRDVRFVTLCLAALAVWTVLQLLPLPSGLLQRLQPGTTVLYQAFAAKGLSLSLDPLNTVQHALFFGALLLWAAGIAGSVNSRKTILWLGGGLVAAGSLQALAGFIGLGHPWFMPNQSWRMRGTFYGPNAFGGCMAVTLPIAYAFMCCMYYRIVHRHGSVIRGAASGSRRARWNIVGLSLGLAGFIIQTGALLMSASRGAVIASLIVGLFFVGWILNEKPRDRRAAFLGRLILVLAIVILLLTGGILDYAFQRIDEVLESGSTASLKQRWYIWQDAVQVLMAHPFGVGLGNFGLASNRFQQMGWQDIQYDFVHNDFLQWTVEWGLVGIVPVLLLLGWLLRWSWVVWKPLRRDSSIWMQRGVALSVYAGLIHALVDYNLSSRPGVSVPFFASVGLLVASGLYQRQDDENEATGPSLAPRRLALKALLLLILFSLLAVFPLSRRIVADITHEKGWVSSMRFRSPLFWLKVQFPEEEEGPSYIKKAQALHPSDGRFSFDIARVILRPVEMEYRTACSTFEREHPNQDQAWFRAIARDALKTSMHRHLEEALPYVRAAVAAQPWQGYAQSCLGLYLMQVLETAGDQHPASSPEWEEALAALKTAERLGPNLTRILVQLCHAYSTAYRATGDEHWRDEAMRVGYHALKSTEIYEGQILQHFQDLHVTIEDMAEMSELHPSFIYRMYQYSSSRELEKDSYDLLDFLQQATARLPMPFHRKMDPEQLELLRQTYFDAATRERARWHLRSGRWFDYMAMREELEAVGSRRIHNALEDVVESRDALVIKLRELRSKQGLPADLTLRWAEMEAYRGHHRIYDDSLAELASLDHFTTNWPGDLEAVYHGDTTAHPNIGLRLCNARTAFEQDDFLQGEKILRDQVVNVIPSFFRYRHRVHWLRSQYEQFRFMDDKAAFHLLEGLASCPTDSTLLEAAVQLGLGEEKIGLDQDEHCNVYEMADRCRPALPMGVQFFHGGLDVLGMDLVQSTEVAGKITCRLYCRFWKIIPDKLHAEFNVHHYSRSTPYKVSLSLEEEFPILFGFGRPQVGAIGVLEAELPMHRMKQQNLSIQFIQAETGNVVITDDGAAGIEILDWGRYVRLSEHVLLDR